MRWGAWQMQLLQHRLSSLVAVKYYSLCINGQNRVMCHITFWQVMARVQPPLAPLQWNSMIKEIRNCSQIKRIHSDVNFYAGEGHFWSWYGVGRESDGQRKESWLWAVCQARLQSIPHLLHHRVIHWTGHERGCNLKIIITCCFLIIFVTSM